MALVNAIQGATHTGQRVSWIRDDGSAEDLTGAILSGTITNVLTGTTAAIVGTLVGVSPLTAGQFDWTYAASDIAAAGQYRVQFKAVYASSPDQTFLSDWLVLPIASSTTPRATMSYLIARLKKLCNGDATLTDFDYLELLDDHAIVVNALLEPRVPFYTEHISPFENLEIGAAVYYGYNTRLTENTDYTADYQRGIITTPAAEYRGLRILGKAYDLNGAAADGWERIAERYALEFDFFPVEGRYYRSQQIDMCLKMAARYRKKAWAISHTVERGDTPPLDSQDARTDLLRRERAGYTQV